MPIRRTLVLALAVAALVPATSVATAAEMCGGKRVTIEGTSKVDNITGTDGDDVIDGRGGGDHITTSKGEDTLCGGEGNDTLTLSGDGAVANLSKRSAVTDGGTATVLDFERLNGTIGNDKLTGDSGNNDLLGNLGNDTINGLGGPDLLDGQGGGSTLSPGSGFDIVRADSDAPSTITYKSSAGAVSFAAASVIEYRGESFRTADESQDQLSGRFATVEGSRYDDRLTTLSLGATTLSGLGGDDKLTSGEGNDSLLGGNGDDTLVGGPGNDTISGGENSPVTNINARGDFVDYKRAGTLDGVVVDLGANVADGDGHDVLSGIESASATKEGPSVLTGNDGPNVLVGDHWYDELYGEGGNDILSGARETDILAGGPGADTMDGGDDSDSFIPGEGDDVIVGGSGCKATCPADDDINFRTAPGPVTVDLSAGTASTGTWGNDTFVEIESAVGSAFNDVLIGDSGDNFLIGAGGTDSADGGAGFDDCEAESHVNCEDVTRRQRL